MARNENRGKEATSKLHQSGLSNVVFHQLDVLDTESIKSLAKFMETEFGRLDILVNNAGASGVVVDEDGPRALNVDPANWGSLLTLYKTLSKLFHWFNVRLQEQG
ncbi:(+)-neomenthol dehydrogenase-like isoform X2 [Coffea arabica]|uniref:(+)-neomenthol dehydrogenase-like isoform X2 n=1 Tax=Coffea arabica TaxID=13443 RepID=A0ABM4VPF0_COFAR